jgi:hypothetical protein
MIIDKPLYYWIYIVPSYPKFPLACMGFPPSKEEYLEHFGKWTIMEDKQRLDELAIHLDPYVECRAIYSIKYTRAPESAFGIDQCVMCVACDDRDRDDIWEILARYGVTLKMFVHDKQVIEMWQPDGVMLEKWLEAYKIDPHSKEAEEIRQNTHENFAKWLRLIDSKDEKPPWTFELI